MDATVVWSLGAALLVLIVPGPTNTLLAAAGTLAHDAPPRRLAFAELAGYAVSVNGLWLLGEAVGSLSSHLTVAIRLGLAVYLAALAVCLWRSPDLRDPGTAVNGRRVFLATLCNPKAAIFAFGLAPGAGDLGRYAVWFAGFALCVLAAGLTWIEFGARVRRVGGARLSAHVVRAAAVALAGFAVFMGGTAIAAIV